MPERREEQRPTAKEDYEERERQVNRQQTKRGRGCREIEREREGEHGNGDDESVGKRRLLAMGITCSRAMSIALLRILTFFASTFESTAVEWVIIEERIDFEDLPLAALSRGTSLLFVSAARALRIGHCWRG